VHVFGVDVLIIHEQILTTVICTEDARKSIQKLKNL